MKADFKRKKIPLSKAGKYLSVTNPHSVHSSAVKSYNASATKSITKPTLNSTAGKGNTTPSAFLNYDGSTAPYKRSRVDSHTYGQDSLFVPKDTSAQSKKSAKLFAIDKETLPQKIYLTPMNQGQNKN